MNGSQIIGTLEEAMTAFNTAVCGGVDQGLSDSNEDRSLLVQRLRPDGDAHGNDPHNQEIPQCMLQDYGKNQCGDRSGYCSPRRYSAGHRKYGDFFEASRRFGEAMGAAECLH